MDVYCVVVGGGIRQEWAVRDLRDPNSGSLVQLRELRVCYRGEIEVSGLAKRGYAALAAVIVLLLSFVSPAGANGVTFPIAAGTSGPYDYEVGVGPFSPLRTDLFVAVTLKVGGNPVIDADVMLVASVDGSPDSVGPLEASNSLDHLPTYEVAFNLPELAKESVSFRIEVDSHHGSSVIRARMIVPDVQGTFNGEVDSTIRESRVEREIDGGDAVAEDERPTDRRAVDPAGDATPLGQRQPGEERFSASEALLPALAIGTGIVALGLVFWLVLRYGRR